MKQCSKCNQILPDNSNNFYKGRRACKSCIKLKNKKYYQENKKHLNEKHKVWVKNNKEKSKIIKKRWLDNNKNFYKEWRKKWRKENADAIYKKTKKYYLNNKERIDNYIRKYKKDKRKNNVEYRLRNNISTKIARYIKSQKNGSILDYLPYSIKELTAHLESQFEDWMTWDNWGRYIKKDWNDNDSSTWKWQIDHIIPQSKLPYDSMDHPNFKKCWSLNNLRPLSAKKNVKKGNSFAFFD